MIPNSQLNLVATADSFSNLSAPAIPVPAGGLVRVELRLKHIPFIQDVFNAAGIEDIFRPFIPHGFTLQDVRGGTDDEGPYAQIDMIANQPSRAALTEPSQFGSLAAVVLFIATNWEVIAIAGLVILVSTVLLIAAITAVRVLTNFGKSAVAGAEKAGTALPWILGGVAVVAVGVVMSQRKRSPARVRR